MKEEMWDFLNKILALDQAGALDLDKKKNQTKNKDRSQDGQSQTWKNQVYQYFLYKFVSGLDLIGAVVLLFFTDWGGLSMFQMQFLQSWFAFWLFVAEVPTGVIADKFGRKLSFALGNILLGFVVIFYGSWANFYVFMISELLFAVASAMISGANTAWLYDTLKAHGQEKQSKQLIGRAHSFRLAGLLIGGPLGSFVAAKIGPNWPMILMSIPRFTAGLIALTLIEPKDTDKISESTRYWDQLKSSLTYLAKHKKLRKLMINAVLVATSAYFVIWYNQALFKQMNIPLFYNGLLFSLMLLVELLVSSNFKTLDDYFGKLSYKRVTAVMVSLSFVLGALALYLQPPFYVGVVISVLFVVLGGGFGLTRLKYIESEMQHSISSKKRAAVISSVSMYRRLILVVFNPVMGFLADQSLLVVFVILSALPLVVLLPFFGSGEEGETD